MDLSEVNVNVKAKMELEDKPALKVGLSENVDYADGFTFPTTEELGLNWSPEIKEQMSGFLHQGMNRKRQKKHGQEIPKKRYPDLIITGAKKCGTTALKIFMNYHPVFQARELCSIIYFLSLKIAERNEAKSAKRSEASFQNIYYLDFCDSSRFLFRFAQPFLSLDFFLEINKDL